MTAWIAANGATVVIALILLVLVFLAGRKVLKNKGGCSSCGHCSDYSHCSLGNKEGKEDKEL